MESLPQRVLDIGQEEGPNDQGARQCDEVDRTGNLGTPKKLADASPDKWHWPTEQ